MNLLLVVTIALRVGVVLKGIFNLIRPHLVWAIFVTATPIVLFEVPWPERVLIALSVLSAGTLGARIGDRFGMPNFFS